MYSFTTQKMKLFCVSLSWTSTYITYFIHVWHQSSLLQGYTVSCLFTLPKYEKKEKKKRECINILTLTACVSHNNVCLQYFFIDFWVRKGFLKTEYTMIKSYQVEWTPGVINNIIKNKIDQNKNSSKKFTYVSNIGHTHIHFCACT